MLRVLRSCMFSHSLDPKQPLGSIDSNAGPLAISVGAGSVACNPDCLAARRALPDQRVSKAAPLPPLGQWVPVSVLPSRIAQSLFASRSVSRSGLVGSEYPITDRADRLRYEPLPHFTITATSARGPLSRWRKRQM